MAAPIGSKEHKRAKKAMPSRVETRSAGCLIALVAYLVACFGFYRYSRRWLWLGFAGPALIALGTVITSELIGLYLLTQARRVFRPRGIDMVVVYSRSPNWEQHVRTNWLPRLGRRAVMLDWTDRAQWRNTLEVRLFNHFIKSWYNFNPAVLVLRGLRRPLVYRFFYAFHEVKAGRPHYLKQLEDELFSHVQREHPDVERG